MTVTRPSVITQRHLDRLAVGYGRQSSPGQVERHTGSTDYQRAQISHARAFGWPEDRCRFYDDFGLSGAASNHRGGYLTVLDLTQSGQVGNVLVSEISRLGRCAAESLKLLGVCVDHDTLITVDGKVYDPRNNSEWTMLAIQLVLAEQGGNSIRDTLVKGKLAKLSQGIAVTAPPVGYDVGRNKAWTKTKDVAVRDALETVFETYFEQRSMPQTMLALLAREVKIPRRLRGGGVDWKDPSLGILADMLNNPNYTPDYYFRRRIDDPTKPRSEKGRRRVRKARVDEMIVVRDHHEGYLSREQWAEIHEMFKRNAWSKDHSNKGKGPALVQGLLRCARHAERIIGSKYKGLTPDGRRMHRYQCKGNRATGGRGCKSVKGNLIDCAVVDAVLERLAPPSIAQVQEAVTRMVAGDQAAGAQRQSERARLERQLHALNEKYLALDHGSHHVRKMVERRLEEVAQQLAVLQQVDPLQKKRMLQSASVVADAMALAADARRVFDAPTTEICDRKELIRIAVRRLVVERWTAEVIEIRIVWADGAPAKTILLRLNGNGAQIGALYAEKRSFEQVAAHLNESGLRNRYGRPFTARGVRSAVRRNSRRGNVK